MSISGIGTDYGYRENLYQRRTQAAGKEKFNTDTFYMEDVEKDVRNGQSLDKEEMLQMISDRIQEVYEKVKNNDTEPSFQIGSQSFTEKEWNRLLEQFDKVQEEIREQMKEEQAKRNKDITTRVQERNVTSVMSKDSKNIAVAAGVAAPETVSTVADEKSVMDSLVAESTTFVYPSQSEENPDKQFITWYTEEGIFCREAGQTSGYFFHIPFGNSNQYEQVMEFLQKLPQDADLSFTVDEGFWKDFLAGKVEETYSQNTTEGLQELQLEDDQFENIDKSDLDAVRAWRDYQMSIGNMVGFREANAYINEQINAVPDETEKNDFFEGVKLERREGQLKSGILGFGSIPGNDDILMVARYAPDSTADNPIVEVRIRNMNDEKAEVKIFSVNIGEVNINNATLLEMFALCCHNDKREFLADTQIRNNSYADLLYQTGDKIWSVLDFTSKKMDWA